MAKRAILHSSCNTILILYYNIITSLALFMLFEQRMAGIIYTILHYVRQHLVCAEQWLWEWGGRRVFVWLLFAFSHHNQMFINHLVGEPWTLYLPSPDNFRPFIRSRHFLRRKWIFKYLIRRNITRFLHANHRWSDD